MLCISTQFPKQRELLAQALVQYGAYYNAVPMVASYRWGNRNMPAQHQTPVYRNGWVEVVAIYGNGNESGIQKVGRQSLVSALFCCTVAPDGVTIVACEASERLHFLRLENIEEL